jgi:hypothetical protein
MNKPLFATLIAGLVSSALMGCGNETPPVAPPATPPSATTADRVGAQLVESLAEELERLKDTLEAKRAAREDGVEGQPVAEDSSGIGGETVDVPVDTQTPELQGSAPAISATPLDLQSQPEACGSFDNTDLDKDGLKDACEQYLAEKHAPVYIYSQEETHYPMPVADFLPQTVLGFFDAGCRPDIDQQLQTAPTSEQLLSQTQPAGCNHPLAVSSNRTRSKGKARTFYLKNLTSEQAKGSESPESWKTYVHAYPNTLRGITLQYWTFYAYDEDSNHGGDWEGVHVVLDSQFKPNRVTLLQESGLKYVPWAQVEQAMPERPRVYVNPKSHTHQLSKDGIKSNNCGGIGGFFSCGIRLDNPDTFIAYDSASQLVPLGERKTPSPEGLFIQYSGLWGTPTGGLFKNAGDWGPAYSGVGMLDNGFIAAWADQMIVSLARFEEAFPQAVSP